MTFNPEILAVLLRLLAERANRAPESIAVEAALPELLTTDDDWVAVQRGIFRTLNCVIPLEELEAIHTVSDLALAVTVRMAGAQAAPADEEDEPDHLRQDGAGHEGYRTVRVFYATDRAAGERVGIVQQYEPRRGNGDLALGVAEVAVPDSHKFGELEGPPWWQFWSVPDPNKHITVVLAGALQEHDFWNRVRGCVASSSERDILLLVHGYNVTFDQGLRRAAQVVKDLKFPGAPILYSWPSRGSARSYSADEATIEWTTPHLKGLLRQLLENAGAAQVHVIAHSLGNRAAIAAIRELQLDTLAAGSAQLNQFVLAAPDIDAGTFRQLAADFARKPRRCTLYVNTEDRALAASGWKHGREPRAGGGSNDLVVVSNVETIDATGQATDFLSHSYFAAASPVVTDLYYVLRSATPDQRARLHARKQGDQRYWRFA